MDEARARFPSANDQSEGATTAINTSAHQMTPYEVRQAQASSLMAAPLQVAWLAAGRCALRSELPSLPNGGALQPDRYERKRSRFEPLLACEGGGLCVQAESTAASACFARHAAPDTSWSALALATPARRWRGAGGDERAVGKCILRGYIHSGLVCILSVARTAPTAAAAARCYLLARSLLAALEPRPLPGTEPVEECTACLSIFPQGL